MVESRFYSNFFDMSQRNDFRLKRIEGQPENTYVIPNLFPRFRSWSQRRTESRLLNTSRESMNRLVGEVFQDAETIGLEVGRRNPAVKILRVGGINWAQEGEQTDLVPERVKMRIDDGKGNRLTFHMSYEMGYEDGKEREWNKVVARMDDAIVDGRKVKLTPEMQREGFTFLSKNMHTILASAKTDQPKSAFVRQESPDASCFTDGHHGSAGRKDLGCSCIEERAESLDIIHNKGGVNCLMPGTGNGNGTEAQDRQIMARNVAARTGRRTRSYHEVYEAMGKHPDSRGDSLTIATLLMEHLFRFNEINNITVLSDSPKKHTVWERFKEGRTIASQQLQSAKRDHIDFISKANNHGYQAATSTQ